MRRLMKRGALILLLLITNFAFGQKVLIENDDANHMILKSFDSRSKEVQGSPYLNENFLPARINDQDKLFSMRYDAYNDEMEIDIDGKLYRLPKEGYYTINFPGLDKSYKLCSYKSGNSLAMGFFVVAFEGDEVSLLVKEKVKYFEEVKQNLGFVEYQPPKLKRVKDALFFGFSNFSTIPVPKKKNDVLKLFSSHSKQVSTFAKEQRLGYKTQEDLIQILEYYNIQF